LATIPLRFGSSCHERQICSFRTSDQGTQGDTLKPHAGGPNQARAAATNTKFAASEPRIKELKETLSSPMPEALLVLFLDILEPHARGLANVLGIVEPLAGGPTNEAAILHCHRSCSLCRRCSRQDSTPLHCHPRPQTCLANEQSKTLLFLLCGSQIFFCLAYNTKPLVAVFRRT
jgi:hypothetical protein